MGLRERVFGISVMIWAALGAPVHADGNGSPVVLELFTSQGCSSCPPADNMFREMAARDDVIPLALHVDYWDYIGWKDSFADPAFTLRQKSYARAAGSRTIYTPQFIVGGVDHVVGYRPMELADLIEQHKSAQARAQLRITKSGDRLLVEATAPQAFKRDVVLQLVTYMPEETVEISRGENAGRSIVYTNIVTGLTPVARWDGAAPFRQSFPWKGDGPIVAILQDPGPGAIIAAARLR